MAIDPITGVLTAGTLIGNLIQGQAAKKAAQRALAQQMAMHAEQMRFAKSGRTDAYGNRVRYDEGLGEWITDLTPQQRANLKAGEREQFLGLTEDAARNRQARRRAGAIGESSAEDYNTNLAEFRYGPRKSEDSIFNEISTLIARERSRPDVAGQRLRARMGSPLVTPNSSSRGSDRSVSDALTARKAALEEYGARESGRNSRLLPALDFFRQGASGGGGAPINYSNINDSTNKSQDAMAQLIASVGASGAGNIGKAQAGLTEATGKQFPSLGDSARMIAALRGTSLRGGGVSSKRPSTSRQASPDFAQASPDFPYEWELGF